MSHSRHNPNREPQRGPSMNAKRWWREHNQALREVRAVLRDDLWGPARSIAVPSRLLRRVDRAYNINGVFLHVYGVKVETMVRDVPLLYRGGETWSARVPYLNAPR